MPAFRRAKHRELSTGDGVTTYGFPIVEGDSLLGLVSGVEDHRLQPGAVLAGSIASMTTNVLIPLSATVRVDAAPGGTRFVLAGTSLVHASIRGGDETMTNVSESDVARVFRVTLPKATSASLTLGSAGVVAEGMSISVRSGYFSDNAGMAIVIEGSFMNEAVDPLDAGDWVEVSGYNTDIAILDGDGRLLIVESLSPT